MGMSSQPFARWKEDWQATAPVKKVGDVGSEGNPFETHKFVHNHGTGSASEAGKGFERDFFGTIPFCVKTACTPVRHVLTCRANK